MNRALNILVWLAIAFLGAGAYAGIAWNRGEPLNSGYLVVAALCTYAIGYRFYSKWIAASVLTLNDRRATPCEVHEDGHDFVKTDKWIVFGHHFAAISGPGPLVGPVLAAQFGYLPGTLWILIGVVLGGAVQDFVILAASMRRDGRSLAAMVRDELNRFAGGIGSVAILVIMLILLAVLGLVVVNALAESPWGVFTVAATIPIAMLMGVLLKSVWVGRVTPVSILGVVLLLAAVWGGKFVHSSPTLHHFFLIGTLPLAWSVILYGLAASILPVWLLLAPRDYLSTFMKLGTIGLLAVGVLIVLPELKMPPVSKFADGTGLVVPGTLFPFCFITIACGAISGFHTLIASGITPKIISRESHARVVGYGAMCLESLVAIMALIAACTLEPDVYLAMNTSGGNAPTAAEKAAAIQKKIDNSGFVAFRQEGESRVLAPIHLDKARMEALAQEVGEPTLYGKTGGAATLAVGMATIFGRITHGKWMDIWYHFAIMFEALFILTTVDAGTRVGRYLLQDFLGGIWRPLGNTKNLWANLLASFLVVAGWGFFLVIGAANPDGGVKALWPIFGIANQLLASIALCLGTTILLKGQLTRGETGRPVYALALLIPLLWLLTVTFSAGFEKLFSQNPSIGFISGIQKLDKDLIPLTDKLSTATTAGDAAAVETAKRAIAANRQVRFNHAVDIPVTMILLGLAATIVAISAFEWWRLLTGRRKPDLTETEPVWLEESSIPSNRAPALGALGSIALGAALIKELSSEAAIEREMQRQSAEASDVMIEESERRSASHTPACQAHRRNRLRSYLAVVDRRSGNPRCC